MELAEGGSTDSNASRAGSTRETRLNNSQLSPKPKKERESLQSIYRENQNLSIAARVM